MERLRAVGQNRSSKEKMAQEIEGWQLMEKSGFYPEHCYFGSWEDIMIPKLSKHSRHRNMLGRTIGHTAQPTNQEPIEGHLPQSVSGRLLLRRKQRRND